METKLDLVSIFQMKNINAKPFFAFSRFEKVMVLKKITA